MGKKTDQEEDIDQSRTTSKKDIEEHRRRNAVEDPRASAPGVRNDCNLCGCSRKFRKEIRSLEFRQRVARNKLVVNHKRSYSCQYSGR
jgi:hypothetical protein